MNVSREINFFIPHTKKSNYEIAYDSMKSAIKYQMGWTATDRRIESLKYFSGKKNLTAKVGEVGLFEHQYEVVAILEAALYIIMTVTKSGEPGPMILVDTKDVLEIHDFKPEAEKAKASLLQPV